MILTIILSTFNFLFLIFLIANFGECLSIQKQSQIKKYINISKETIIKIGKLIVIVKELKFRFFALF